MDEEEHMAVSGPGQPSYGKLFDLLRERPETTRTELVERSGLSKATVSEAVSSMMERGLLTEIGKRQPGRGRSQVVLAFQPAVRLVLGAQFTEHGCHVVLADLRAGPIAWAERANSATDPEGFVNAVADCANELRAKADAPILGLGVGVPGLVDPSGRRVVLSVPYGWEQVPIAEMLEQRLGMPVVVTNRAKAAALGEFWQGEHDATHEHLLYVHMGAGIVAGLVNRGQLYVGHGGAAGELGHTTVLPDGPACACGNRGCLHMLASESALVREVRSRVRRQPETPETSVLSLRDLGTLSIGRLQEAAGAGDQRVLEVVREAGSWAGIALANTINLLNPSLVVIGGSLAEFGDPFLQSVRNEVRQRALWDAIHDVEIALSRLGDSAGTIGGAAVFLDTVDVGTVLA
jgi:glucokinase-like ROK family protein